MRKRSWTETQAARLEHYGAPVAILICQALITWTTSPMFPQQHPRWQKWLLASSIFVSLIAGGFLVYRAVRMSRVMSERDEFESVIQAQRGSYSAVFEAHLGHISEGLEFTKSERVTVYRKKGNKFVPLARFSLNAALRERSRTEYPPDQGCIAAAWADEKVFDNAMPSFKDDPEAYVRYQAEKWRMPEDVTRAMKMKSRSIAAFRIEDHERHGVIVFESTNKDRWTKRELERIMRIENKHIAHLLRVFAPFEPDPAVAAAEGF